jgi:hypothetical protein
MRVGAAALDGLARRNAGRMLAQLSTFSAFYASRRTRTIFRRLLRVLMIWV